MKTNFLPLLTLLLFSLSQNVQAQCLQFANQPQILNTPGPSASCNQVFTTAQVPVTQSIAYVMPAIQQGMQLQIDLSAWPGNDANMELVVVNNLELIGPENILAANQGAPMIEFTAPILADYFLIFNQKEIELCGVPNLGIEGMGIDIMVICPPCLLNRQEVTQVVLDPQISGLEFFPGVSNMWMPMELFPGFNAGFEGLVPVGTQIEPFALGFDPFPGPGIVAPFDAYFMWIDDFPYGGFQHPTRFVLVDPTDCTPSINEGTIIVSDQGWWPKLMLPGQPNPIEFFNSDLVTRDPPGPANPDGLLAGDAPNPDDVIIPVNPPPNNSQSKSAGVVVSGDNRGDFRGDVPRWRRSLQEDYGLDSARILSVGDSAVTIDTFCVLLDRLCTLVPTPDTIYIRVSTHGNVGSIWFADGTLSAAQFCQKMKKVAQKGVPIMLLLDACNSSSMLDANNWGFPAGSMIIVGAQSGSSALGAVDGFQSDSIGNAIPGTKFTGGMLSTALQNCKVDRTDGTLNADTNKDGNVDDCEAFNWVNTQKPCFVRPLNMPFTVGTHTIDKIILYPAGPPWTTPDTTVMVGGRAIPVRNGGLVLANPMPSYVAVGNFGKTMNFNVQNNSGAAKNNFCMVFRGDVSAGFGTAWRSDANDNTGATWASGGNVTATFDAATNCTTVCWKANSTTAANSDFIHFGYFPEGDKKLQPKRQYWANSAGRSLVIADVDKVPTTESSTILNASGSPLTVRTANIGEAAGGWKQKVNYKIGYRVSPVEIPLADLTLGNTSVNSLTYNLAGMGTLDTNEVFEFTIDIPAKLKVGEVLVLQVELDWTHNTNKTMQLIQWSDQGAAICEGDIVYNDANAVPDQTNSSGTITVNQLAVSSGVTTFNAKNAVILNPGTEINSPAEVCIYIGGCNAAASFQQEETSLIMEETSLLENHVPKTMEDKGTNLEFTIAPNPFWHAINISYQLEEASHVNLSIFDFNGKEVKKWMNNTLHQSGYYSNEFSVSDLPPGMYFTVIQTDKTLKSVKVFKTK